MYVKEYGCFVINEELLEDMKYESYVIGIFFNKDLFGVVWYEREESVCFGSYLGESLWVFGLR